MRTTLPAPARKILGVFFLVTLMGVYALIAVTVAAATISNAPWYAHTLFFLFSGVLWVVPAMVVIKWMARQD